MPGYIISTDSTADLPFQYIDEKGIPVACLRYTMGGTEYMDDLARSGNTKALYEAMRNGVSSSTSQVNVDEFENLFRGYLKKGQDILHIAFSSALSGTCSSAMIAAQKMGEEFPERKIHVVDSLSASMGEGLLVYNAVKMKEASAPIDDVWQWVEKNKLRVVHLFTVESLEYLRRGGRVSRATAMMATALDIKPIMHVDNNGELVPLAKAISRKKSLRHIVKDLEEQIADPKEQIVMISHGDCLEDAERVREMIAERVRVKEFMINYVGPVIGSHSGPGTIAVFFLAEHR